MRGNDEDSRRQRLRESRTRRHGGGVEVQFRVCPECRTSIPYLTPVHESPAVCGHCGYVWSCADCGTDFSPDDRDDAGRPPAVCPACDAAIEGGYETDTVEGVETWSDK